MMSEEEFDAFFAVSYSRLVGQLYALTGDWGVARETVLEAFVRGWDQRGHFDLEAAPDSWIRTAAWRLAGRRIAGDDPGLELTRTLRGLGPDERWAIVLRYMCGLSIEETAAETGVTVNAVVARLANVERAAETAPSYYAQLADEVHDFANEHVHPRLAARQVRELGERRGRKRRGVAVGGVGALAVAGIIAVTLLAVRPGVPSVAPAAGRHTATQGGGVTAELAGTPAGAAPEGTVTSDDPRPTPSTRL